MIRQEILHFHVCGGSGGGKKGFNRGEARVGNAVAAPRCIGGVDIDLAGIADFNRIPGAPATPLDLFTREQFVAFHGVMPPEGWREAVPDDFRRAAHGERPHVVFMSTPCKGFSGLLSERLSAGARYQALNGLTLRAVWLTLEAWSDDPPEFILFENVPRIATRGRWLLDQIKALLDAYGYRSAETTHDCGVIGGLGQSRKRFLLVARHAAKVPPCLYEPEKKRLLGVGEVLDRLPLPGCPAVGPMHRMPRLQWKTWVRLAFVEAGSDWRSLNRLRVADGILSDFAIEPDKEMRRGSLGVNRWDEAAPTVTSRGFPLNGAFSVADPRRPQSDLTYGQYGVKAWNDTAATVTAQSAPGGGLYAVADPRPGFGGGTHRNVYRIVPWGDHARTVTSSNHPSGGAACVADPRAAAGFGGKGKYRVTAYAEAAGTVIGASTTGQGAFALADPRPAAAGHHHGVQGVLDWSEPSGAIAGASRPTNGRFAVADPRMTWAATAHSNKLKVARYDAPAGTVTGADRVGSGALCVADPRPEFSRDGRTAYLTGGHYGVLPYDAPSGAVTGSGQHDNGRWSVADPRLVEAEDVAELPAADDRLVAVIQALDGTWHRPFTTYELAALQGYVDPDEPLIMEGASDSAWRERIGNMVPPPSAAAIMSVIARTLLLAWSGETFVLSSEPIWVRPVALAVALDLTMMED